MRIALGASRRTVFWLVLKQALETATIGLCGAVASQKLTSGGLFGISPVDPPTLVVAATFLLAVAASQVQFLRSECCRLIRQVPSAKAENCTRTEAGS